MIGRKARPRPAFLAVLGLLCFSGKGALGLATHDVVAPRHALRAAALCDAAQHAEIGIEAALIQLDRLPASELQRGAVLRYVAEASLEALEAEWRRTAAWIDDAREQLALASARAADLTSEHVAGGVTGAFCWTLIVLLLFGESACVSAIARRWFCPRRVEVRLFFSSACSCISIVRIRASCTCNPCTWRSASVAGRF